MTQHPEASGVASALVVGISMLRRRLRQVQADGDLTLPESSALARLDRGGPATASELARVEQISPQSMGATLGVLEAHGLIGRQPDPSDGRRAVLSLTATGQRTLRDRRTTRTAALAEALAAGFTPQELAELMTAAPLLERLAQSI
ncbi:MAG: MarR family transcriptional regulator [Actinomycetota bacterium]